MSIDKRTLLGPIYRPLVRARHSSAVRRLASTLDRPKLRSLIARQAPWLAFDISERSGFGAMLSHAVLLYSFCEKLDRRASIISTNPLYTEKYGLDCLTPLFGTKSSIDSYSGDDHIAFKGLLWLEPLGMQGHISLDDASRVFWQYLEPTPKLNSIVNDVLSLAGRKSFDLAIHYRGTDKSLEAAPASFEYLERTIKRYQNSGHSLDDVFLATDDLAIEQQIKERFKKIRFWSFVLGVPSDPKTPRHFSDMLPQDKATEAAVNILLLSKAPVLVRSTSYMSAMSKIVNPSLQTITLNRTFDGSSLFPEQEISTQEANGS